MRFFCLSSFSLLVSCSTTMTTKFDKVDLPVTHSVSPQAILPAASAQAACSQLKAQFQGQLPAQILMQMHWSVGFIDHSLPSFDYSVQPMCQIMLSTDGATIEKLGLTPQFMTATFERLEWIQYAQPNTFVASSPTNNRLLMTQGRQIAVLDYRFAPPEHVCLGNEPIAACSFPRKKWIYQLKVSLLSRGPSA